MSKLLCFLLWFFLGFTGAHLVYVKRYSQAIIWASTCGLLGVGWLYDGYNLDRYLAEASGAGRSSPVSFKKRAFKSLLAFILAQLAHALAFAAVVDTPSTTIRAWSIFLSASAVTLVGNTGSQKLSLLPVVLGSTGGSVLALLLASAGWPEKAYMCQSVCAVLAAYFYTRDRNGQQESIVPGGRCAHALLISMLQSSLIIVAAASLIQHAHVDCNGVDMSLRECMSVVYQLRHPEAAPSEANMLGWSGMLDVLQSEASNAQPTGNILQLFSESDQDSHKNSQDAKRQSWFKWSFQSSMSTKQTRSIFSSGHSSMRVESTTTHTSDEL